MVYSLSTVVTHCWLRMVDDGWFMVDEWVVMLDHNGQQRRPLIFEDNQPTIVAGDDGES